MKIWSCILVKKHNLLAIAGTVWLIAGFNVARLGVVDYFALSHVTAVEILMSIAVFSLFGVMFYKMTGKHSKRIANYEQEKKPFWNFFDLKSYCIMTFMMGGGIWLRSSGLVSSIFIAVFYTGLGCALAAAGFIFWKTFIQSRKQISTGFIGEV